MPTSQIATELLEYIRSRSVAANPSYLDVTCYIGAFALFAILAYIVVEQILFIYRKNKYGYAGPTFIVPLIGSIVEMVRDPYGFWERQRLYAHPGVSCTSLLGKFLVFCTDVEGCHTILRNNAEDQFMMELHPSARTILGDTNIAFLCGDRHLMLRKSFIHLFGRKALSVYLERQQEIILQHLDQWVRVCQTGGALEVRTLMRDMNQETSQQVFAGPYIDDHKAFGRDYIIMTEGFLSLPINLPGTAVWKAVEARKRLSKILGEAARRSKKAMAEGKEPRCLLDFWSIRVNELINEAEAEKKAPPVFASDSEMGDVVLDFLFASQDASTASLVWCVHYLTQRPDVLARVREEQARLRPNGESLSYDLLEQMHYTRWTVKEILRIRTPPPMVPNVAMEELQLTEKFRVPKGALVIPSTWNCCMQGFSNPTEFNPDRWDPAGLNEGEKYAKNYIPFGIGPHMCAGKDYAYNNLIAFLAVFASNYDFDRVKDGKENTIIYLPTLYPKSCIINIRQENWLGPRGRMATTATKSR